ncbi:Rhodanese-related sulfurtransferase [Candidatus Methylocalor cossyra]|uniref:Rhodanese-related sulfurtransferase n=1 Tax=Candidatus Methylocalor cossyra TaxID=3108543 RepID=A0ABM9NH46_9GAMM
MDVTLDRLVEFVSNHWIMSSGLLIVVVLLIQDFLESAFRKYQIASPIQAVTLMNGDDTLVVDVREPGEYADGHIEGARNIPLSKLEENIPALEAHKQRPLIVVCQSGTRSPQACRKLSAQGFAQVYELKGGMLAWEDQKLPISKKRKK